jgi:hypothetical protein
LKISLSSALQRRAFRWKLPIRSRQPRLFSAFPCPTPAVESARLCGAPFDVGYTALGNPFMGTFASVMRLGNAPLERPVTALRSPHQRCGPPVVRARAASRSSTSIPFGASHRLYFDTPPLIGNCPDTLVSRQIPQKTQGAYESRYLARYRRKQASEAPNG